ncbi:hypothetical protein V1477_000633 [Vespula maculifrons]|uniref:Uncharacterized protein n=1 Tax=Vespula maculifrons TaxID=7453 RepID=A0ABD2D255_VESMC
MLKCAAIRSEILAASKIPIQNKYCRPRSHRVEVAAVGDPRTNGDSNFYYHYYYQESKATGRPPLPTNSSLQTLKLQPHASPHLGTDLRIAQLSNIGSFDHHLSTTVPPWSLADETDEAGGSTRASGDSTLKSTIRDAFPLRELRASQQTGDV